MNNNSRMMLGYLGFIPFGILTILPWILGEAFTKQAYFLLTVYGAIIMSFLAGMSWGWNISSKKNLTLGILFSLISFFSIIIGYFFLQVALIIFAITFPLFYIFEKHANEFMSDETYLKLRRNLTSAVSGCFLLSLLTTF
ncbi:MAG: hypothetical protein CMK55_03230 [Proteobacteria bacterium]|nr:hypothetical protein [Pseudomonadota bacterium]RZO98802.1 MAG: DUF3429 family protein [Gammaproteobacteria bacterium]|tara:strand:+ start:624 stop:1043 length:420 start_codon:yes stop_codon:yes gene_type:complete